MTAGFMTGHICHLGICTYHGSLTSRETLTNQVRPSVLHQFHNTRVYSSNQYPAEPGDVESRPVVLEEVHSNQAAGTDSTAVYVNSILPSLKI